MWCRAGQLLSRPLLIGWIGQLLCRPLLIREVVMVTTWLSGCWSAAPSRGGRTGQGDQRQVHRIDIDRSSLFDQRTPPDGLADTRTVRTTQRTTFICRLPGAVIEAVQDKTLAIHPQRIGAHRPSPD
jgi:hypothetical protein